MKLKKVFEDVKDPDAVKLVQRQLDRCWEDGAKVKVTVEFEDDSVSAVRAPQKGKDNGPTVAEPATT